MDTVIVMTHTKIDYDSRIRRQITVLSKYFDIILCSQRGDEERKKGLPENIHYISFEPFSNGIGLKLFKLYLSKDEEKIKELEGLNTSLELGINILTSYETYRCDLSGMQRNAAYYLKDKGVNVKAIIANDITVLPVAYRLKNILRNQSPQIKLIGDMHELHFNYSEGSSQLTKDFRLWASDTYLPKCDVISTVSDWISKIYSDRYKRTPIKTIRNVAEANDLKPTKNEGYIRLVNVGAAQEMRKIEKMIDCMLYLEEKYIFDLYLMYEPETQSHRYVEWLKQYIVEKQLTHRVRIMEPVESNVLIKTIHEYDMGIFYIEPLNENHKHGLPNKLFEFIQARVAVVTTPLKSMKQIIEYYDVGKVSSEYTLEDFVRKIREVADYLDYYKNQSDKAAQVLNAENEWNKVVKYIQTNTLEDGEYIKGYRLSQLDEDA